MQVTIERLGHRGDGIAPGPVFVPGALPGEVVEGVLEGDTLQAPKIVTPVADRVRPPCRHAKACGGCALQHASDGFLAEWKAEVIRLALAGQGLEAPIRPVLTSPPRSRRRATLAGKRTKGGVILGFHGRASDTVVAVPDCQLLHPDLMAAFPAMEEITALGGSRKGALALGVTSTPNGPDIAVTGGKPLDATLRMELGQLADRHHLARLAWDGEVVALARPPVQRMGRAEVAPPPGAFLQATPDGEAALVSAVTESVSGARKLVDLFSGCGTFALPLAARAEVHAVESGPGMLQALDAGWRGAEGLHRVTTETRDLFRRPLMVDELNRFDAVVIDPPRAGAEAQTAQLAASRVPVIAAVSCNSVTFARDARALIQGGYRLEWVQPVDQFRWSPHVELVARFGRAPA
ncbi:class I SAM-dependent RNA methyltransferase [Acidimangrovimonas sediminis]|uniref:class I SAM-dependent RNA methyltransferase n=1 Tax=Acidimangrovimonas sediminis TaxID=2056283 RepID=UPI000C806AAF|nr:class I SAM-dependent RNA methyltransferase [Acidimangrovimonas sediminis]